MKRFGTILSASLLAIALLAFIQSCFFYVQLGRETVGFDQRGHCWGGSFSGVQISGGSIKAGAWGCRQPYWGEFLGEINPKPPPVMTYNASFVVKGDRPPVFEHCFWFGIGGGILFSRHGEEPFDHSISIPLWMLVGVLSIRPARAFVRWRRVIAVCRADPTICQACGYDLRVTPDRCPECGTVPK